MNGLLNSFPFGRQRVCICGPCRRDVTYTSGPIFEPTQVLARATYVETTPLVHVPSDEVIAATISARVRAAQGVLR